MYMSMMIGNISFDKLIITVVTLRHMMLHKTRLCDETDSCSSLTFNFNLNVNGEINC